jgi:hypothetical protein
MTDKTTLLPWYFDRHKYSTVNDAANNIVFHFYRNHDAARLAVRAVNNFDAMKEALKALINCPDLADADLTGDWALDEETQLAIHKARTVLAQIEKE